MKFPRHETKTREEPCCRLPKGVLTASCEAELQELMKQIDIMMATKKKDWEHQIQSLQSKVELQDKENLLQKSTIDQKHKEVGTGCLN